MASSQSTSSNISPLEGRHLQLAREALAEHGRLDEFARLYGFESEEEVLRSIALTMGMPFIDIPNYEIDPELLHTFSPKVIHRYTVFPVGKTDDQSIIIATKNPFDVNSLDQIAAECGRSIEAAVAAPTELIKLIKAHFGVGAETVEGLMAQKDEDAGGLEVLEDLDFDSSEDSAMAQEASVVRLVNEILIEAVNSGTSDIHIESQAKGIKIRYRIDGVLQTQPMPPEINRFQAAITSRLKIMSRMNIAEKRIPQDGRIKLKISGREIDIRVSIIPMLHGESVVMRVLDKDRMNFTLQGIGMDLDIYQQFGEVIKQPHGIVLVTGPTGSGKTTTLYSALNEIKSDDTKIITTEDPIEYQLEGINQIQVHHKVGLTFATSLRAILRHDPDVCLVGEIRDQETAENAIQAALTGHLVFSTLHTNDAAGVFMRLGDMGVEPFMVSSTVEGILAQRLVRRLCPHCKEKIEPDRDIMPSDFPWEEYEAANTGYLYKSVGCRECRGSGYSGRAGIYELLVANDEVKQMATEARTTTEIKEAAIRGGMKTLRQNAWRKVIDGRTTVDEVIRVAKADH
ncbi:Type II secretion system protein E [Polystyrenella longa]|uniref:Type II secretion system protein E n=1 Tax=Polystyrenella longa TaxID=2528007 RepID=A0A518CRD8_9PLAN|nr:GspE/PulE family protein [Polystyrenella longa]QDU81796.1 Type II secretion system protein E [Polystyrenella longa]